MIHRKHFFGSTTEAIVYPLLLLVVLWLIYWADHLFPMEHFYKYGVKPKTVEGLKGILLMPLLHSKNEIEHIVNNSLPTVVLLGTLIYYYRDIALKVFLFSWILTGIGLWSFANTPNSYHIGMSGVIYALAGFLFTSGVIRKFRPLQGISLFVAFVYGSMIWGIFPMKEHVSWEGHLSGLIVGVVLALYYRKKGPQAPKYQYEIEKELGIEPPDLEGEWNRKVEEFERKQQELEERKKQADEQQRIIYHYKPMPKPSPRDENDQQD
jgi:membrane associated rhomboid family serine protease